MSEINNDIEDIFENLSTNLIDNDSFEYDKKDFNDHIQSKISKLDKRMRYVNYKFEDLKYSFKKYSIMIIYFATLLTLVEAFLNSIKLDISETTNSLINFIPLLLSSLITLIASIIKFNKYEEKIENITRSTEKCIATVAKMKGVKEDLYFCIDQKSLLSLKEHFNKNIYQEYLESNTEIEKQLIDSDYTIYLKRVAINNLKEEKIELIKKYKLDELKEKYNNKNNKNNKNNNNNNKLSNIVISKDLSNIIISQDLSSIIISQDLSNIIIKT